MIPWPTIAPTPPHAERLAQEIHLWHVSLAALPPTLPAQLLTDSERQRAARFTSPLLRRRFFASHCARRLILAAYLHIPAQRLHFTTHAHGKPQLASPHQALCFNLSHSGDTLLLAVTQQRAIGVDVEEISVPRDYPRLVARCLSPPEQRFWQALAPAERSAAFYRFWTIKEAWAKAVGRGIAIGLAKCEIDLATSGQFARLPEPYPAQAWRYRSLRVPHGCAAVVWQHDAAVRCTVQEFAFDWETVTA